MALQGAGYERTDPKKEIERLKQQIKKLEAQIASKPIKLHHFKPEKYYKLDSDTYLDTRFPNHVLRLSHLDDDGWLIPDKTFPKLKGKTYKHIHYREATPDEIESALQEEWERRCKEAGYNEIKEAKYECLIADFKYEYPSGKIKYYSRQESETRRCGNSLYYDPETDTLSENGRVGPYPVYHKGEWAEIKRNTTNKFFDWEVEYWHNNINIYCEGHKGSGEKVTKSFLKDAYHLLHHVQDKTGRELIDELQKLDL